ncbi:hypothetical protein EV368DRAFT_89822 [Lentinula lateritia]|nr:hypothetical protein EV368DRAFT_89822 [Lentinula lateritia]
MHSPFGIKVGGFYLGPHLQNFLSPLISTSHTITKTTPAIGSIPITGGTSNQPPALTHLITPSTSDEECELEPEMECTRERMRRLKEKRKAEEEAKKKVEEEAARQAAEEERQCQEAAAVMP